MNASVPRSAVADLNRQIIDLLRSVVGDLDPRYGGGALSASAYDTAWVAMVRDPESPARLAFPRSLGALLELQADDGGFGGPFPFTIVPTLAALLCLERAPTPSDRSRHAALRARGYLDAALARWDVRTHESVGAEVLVPSLLDALEGVGVGFEFSGRAEMRDAAEQKLSLIRPEQLYAGPSSLAFSLEAFGSRLDFTRLGACQHHDGGWCGSPSATAAALIHGPWSAKSGQWLASLSARRFEHEGAMPPTYPCESMELAWCLHDLHRARFDIRRECPPELCRQLISWLEETLTIDGMAQSRFSNLPPDADDTAVSFAVLEANGRSPRFDPFTRFERESHFVSYPAERAISITTNAHVLDAVALQPRGAPKASARTAKLVAFLCAKQRPEGCWIDKWHASPHYATSCCVRPLVAAGARGAVERALQWIVAAQDRETGGFGAVIGPTAEETALAVHALLDASEAIGTPPQIEGALARAAQFLEISEARPPALWICKQLYAPRRMIAALVLGARLRLARRREVYPS